MTKNPPGGLSQNRGPRVPTGSEVAHYRIDAHLGSGGTADVYLATDQKLDRQVALKIPARELMQDSEYRERFLDEARAAAALNHPSIVTVHEVGEGKDQMFIAMEFVKGETLRGLLRSKRLTCAEIAGIAEQICDGLSEAHAAGQVHCDIKPENIIIDDRGRVKILDFGIARAILEAQPERKTTIEGSLHYLAPEVINGQTAGPSADLYSLGVLLYEMVSGQPPFQAEYEASLVYSIMNEEPRKLRSLRAAVPERLEALIMKLLAKDGSERFQNAEQVKQELSRSLDDVAGSEQARPTPPIQRTLKTWLPPLAALALAAGITLLLPLATEKKPAARTIVVLPFDNLGAAEDEYFADGITDAVTSQLAKISGLKVISRASSMQYKSSDLAIDEIADELQAGYIVSGRIYWDKSDGLDQVRINVSLADAEDGTYLWTESYERVLDKIFAIQSDISQKVSQALGVVVLAPEQAAIESEPTANLQAYDLYLRANDYFNRSWDYTDIEIAIEMYQRAAHLDTTFALAYAMLSRGHASMFWEFFDRSPRRRELALEGARRALQLNPDLVESHLAMGYYFYHCELDYESALAEFGLGLAIQPNNSDLLNATAAVQRRQGRLEASAESFKKALRLDPSSHLKAFDVGLTYGMMRDFGEAGHWLDRAIALAPDWPLSYIYKAWLQILQNGDKAKARKILDGASGRCELSRSKYYWWLARIVEPSYRQALDKTTMGTDTVAYYLHVARINRLMGNRESERVYSDTARTLLEERVQTQQEEARYYSDLGLAYTGLREKQKALECGRHAVELLPTTKEAFDAPFLIINLTESLVVFGEYDEAVQMLELLLHIPGFVSSQYLRLDPLWVPLQDHPRFRAILKQAASA